MNEIQHISRPNIVFKPSSPRPSAPSPEPKPRISDSRIIAAAIVLGSMIIAAAIYFSPKPGRYVDSSGVYVFDTTTGKISDFRR